HLDLWPRDRADTLTDWKHPCRLKFADRPPGISGRHGPRFSTHAPMTPTVTRSQCGRKRAARSWSNGPLVHRATRYPGLSRSRSSRERRCSLPQWPFKSASPSGLARGSPPGSNPKTPMRLLGYGSPPGLGPRQRRKDEGRVTPPTWLDAHGRRRRTLACWNCVREVAPMRYPASELRPHGCAPPRTREMPDWCRCSTEYVRVPLGDGWWAERWTTGNRAEEARLRQLAAELGVNGARGGRGAVAKAAAEDTAWLRRSDVRMTA